MTMWQRWSVVLGSSLVLWGISERVFWSLIRPDDTWYFFLLGVVPYLVAAYVTLVAIEYFKVSTFWGLMLVGALYGWIVEGIVAMTVFGAGGIPLPFSLSWTALAWHMLIAVGIFWWWHRLVLVRSFKRSLVFSTLFGLGWGVWSMTWFFEESPIINSVGEYSLHAFAVTLLMIIGYLLLGRGVRSFSAPKIEQGIMFAIVIAYFALITVPTVWYALIVIPVLALVLYIPLRRNRSCYETGAVIEVLTQKVPLRNILTLLIAPVIATIIYAVMLVNSGLLFPINFMVLFITTPLGFAVFGWAWWKVYRGTPVVVSGVQA